MINVPKSATLSLLMTLAVLSSWQIAEAADGARGRHSLIHRPQIQPVPLTPAPSSPQPQLQSPSLSQPVQRKVVRRPAAPVSPAAEVSPLAPGNSAHIDAPPPAPQSYNPEDAPAEPDMLPPPEPQESPTSDAP